MAEEKDKLYVLKVSQDGEILSVTREKFLSLLSHVIAGHKLPRESSLNYYGQRLGKMIDVTGLTKESAALMYYEVDKHGEARTAPRQRVAEDEN